MDIDQYVQVLRGIRNCLKETKNNLERHCIPLSRTKSKERAAIRKKIRAIEHAMAVAKRLEETLSLTIDDMADVMQPFDMDVKTQKFLDRIMSEEPTDDELRKIEDENG